MVTIVAGVDVGSGRARKSTGLCRTRDIRFLVTRVTSDGAEHPRERVLPRRCDVLAVGGPVVRPGFPPESLRAVERVFSVGPFKSRCKPNATGKTGRDFRSASTQCLEQVEGAEGVGPQIDVRSPPRRADEALSAEVENPIRANLRRTPSRRLATTNRHRPPPKMFRRVI